MSKHIQVSIHYLRPNSAGLPPTGVRAAASLSFSPKETPAPYKRSPVSSSNIAFGEKNISCPCMCILFAAITHAQSGLINRNTTDCAVPGSSNDSRFMMISCATCCSKSPTCRTAFSRILRTEMGNFRFRSAPFTNTFLHAFKTRSITPARSWHAKIHKINQNIMTHKHANKRKKI